MNDLYFITGNKGKLADAQSIIPELKQLDIDLPEIQEIDSKKIIQCKLEEATKVHSGNFIVADASIHLDALGGLPGPLIKWFYKELGNEGIYTLVEKYGNPRVMFVCQLGLMHEGVITYFDSVLEGEIVKPRGSNGFAWDPIFMPTGSDKTFAEMERSEKSQYNTLTDALKKLLKHLEGYD